MFSLEGKFGVIFVYPLDDTQPAQEKPEVLEALDALGKITFGASTLEGVGYWQPTGEFERAIHIYTSFDNSPETLAQLRASVFPVVTRWAVDTRQEAVAFEVGSALEIWDTEDLVEEVA